MWKIYVFLFIIVLLGCAVPFIQFCSRRKRIVKDIYSYTFSKGLFEREYTNDISFSTDFLDRKLVATRGWVRGAKGDTVNNLQFEEEKKAEYEIELP